MQRHQDTKEEVRPARWTQQTDLFDCRVALAFFQIGASLATFFQTHSSTGSIFDGRTSGPHEPPPPHTSSQQQGVPSSNNSSLSLWRSLGDWKPVFPAWKFGLWGGWMHLENSGLLSSLSPQHTIYVGMFFPLCWKGLDGLQIAGMLWLNLNAEMS